MPYLKRFAVMPFESNWLKRIQVKNVSKQYVDHWQKSAKVF